MSRKLDSMIGKQHGVWIIYDQSSKGWLRMRCTRCGAESGCDRRKLKEMPVYHYDCVPPDIDNDKRIARDNCKACKYWRTISASGLRACHYLLDNNSSRPRKLDGSCAGWEAKNVKG